MSLGKLLASGAIIGVYKPLDWTSFDIIRKIQGLTKREIPKLKVGHAGTLDPKAEGLVIICTQQMTKRIEELQLQTKTYIAKIALGATRPSHDLETEIDQTYETSHISEQSVRDVLNGFLGSSLQTPPIYSALKVDGKRAYHSARAGKELKLAPREIMIHAIELLSYDQKEITISVIVSKGTYIRTLAYDIGVKLNSGAYLAHLIRTAIGAYHSDEAYTIDTIDHELRHYVHEGIS